MIDVYKLDTFTKSYLETALWSSCDDKDEPLDITHGIDDMSQEFLAQAINDCKNFRNNAGTLLDKYDSAHAGYDFWLTRNGHGAGFWDGDYEHDDGEKLTEISKTYGECNLYVGDDGKIYS